MKIIIAFILNLNYSILMKFQP